jgi:hypothetical protein
MDTMTPEQGLDWIHEQEIADPHFADTEMTLRRTALQVQRELGQSGDFSVTVPIIGQRKDGFGSFMEVRVRARGYRVGGLEELLMIEEQLRRALRNVKTVQERR